MARHVFYALHYDADRTRVAGILESRALEGHLEATRVEWAKLQRSGDFAIQRWIENQLKGRSCTIVLIGTQTAMRPWIHYEIKRSRQLKLALFGIHVHHLTDAQGRQSEKGENPFEHPETGLGSGAAAIPVYDPPETESTLVYRHIADNMARWADDAVGQRRHWQ
jgi:hypothetical protein